MRSVNTFKPRAVSVFTSCIFLFSAIVFAEDNPIPQQVQDWQKAAQSAVQQKNHNAAVSIYAQIIQAYPQTQYAIEAHRETAALFIQTGRIQDAESRVQLIKTEFSTHPDVADSLYGVARHYERNDLSEQAIRLHRYNSATYSESKKGMWSQGAVVHYFIEHKDFATAQKEYEVMLDRFKDQPTLPQEIHQVAEKYRMTDEIERAFNLHQYNAVHSPVSSMYTMWSQGALVHHYVTQNDFVSAQREYEVMINRFSDQPTLPQELHLIAGKLKNAGQIDRFLDLHRYNATHSPVTSKYTMWSQGALVHYFIEQREFYKADYEYKELLIRFSDQPTLPQEIYQFALKYNGVGETGKALELHRYNATHSSVSAIHTMQSQGAIVHYSIEHKDFATAQKEYEVMLGRFTDQPTLPQEIYQFALKYHGIGETGKALELHRYNATHSPASSKHTMWSQGALVHYYIEHKDFANAQKEYVVMLDRFKDQSTLPQEIGQIADKYQQKGQYEPSRNLCRYGLETYPEPSWRHVFQKVLIKTYLAEKDYEQAATVAAELIGESSERSVYVKTMTDLGHIYRAGRLWNQSIQYYQQALEKAELPKEELDVYAGMARVSVWLGNNAKVQEIVDLIYADFLKEERVDYFLFMIGEEYYFMGYAKISQPSQSIEMRQMFSKAAAFWERVISQLPDTDHAAHSFYSIGMIHLHLKEYDKAIPYYVQMIQKYPQYYKTTDAVKWCGICYNELCKQGTLSLEENSRIIEPLIDALAIKGDIIAVPELCFAVGESKYKAEQWTDALKYLELYLKTQTGRVRNPESYYMLAQTCEKMGNMEKMADYYRDYVDKASPESNEDHWIQAHMQLTKIVTH